MRIIFADRLRSYMRENELNTAQVAKLAKVDRKTIANALDAGGPSTTLATVEAVAAGLKLDPAWLFGVDGATIDASLLRRLLEIFLKDHVKNPRLRSSLAESVVESYEVARSQSVDSRNDRELRLLTDNAVRKLSDLETPQR